jgi:benzoylformate decarboxylase
VSLVGYGAAIYTISALWTAAHHRLPVVWGILDNGGYRTLKENARRGGSDGPTPSVAGADLVDPPLDFVTIARGFGVDAQRVERPADVGPAFRDAIAARRPALIDLAISGQLARP